MANELYFNQAFNPKPSAPLLITKCLILISGENQCIEEEGTHEELLAKEGLYHTLVMYQQQVQV